MLNIYAGFLLDAESFFCTKLPNMLNLQMPVIVILFLSLGCNDNNEDIATNTPKFKPAISAGTIVDEKLQEASGLVASRTNKGMFWVINDSGNDAKLFLIDDKGQTVHSYWINGVNNNDWEDIAIYSDNSGKSFLYIGDIGDNMALRKNISLIVLEEPTIINANDTILTVFKNYALKYPDGAKDSETLMIDPFSAAIYIVTKREKNVFLYEVPELLNESDTVDLTFITNLPFFNVTAGDISENGQEVLLKTYDAIYYWKRLDNESIPETITGIHESIPYSLEPQGESIAWSVNGNGFYTLSEKSWAQYQILYFYERN